jgi:magnesium chelatase family protein
MQIEVPALPESELTQGDAGEPSAAIRARVAVARQMQLARQGKPNARLSTKEIDLHCQPDMAGMTLLKQAINRLDLSARAYHRILKMARTIADLAGAQQISPAHIAEAVQYRRFMTG